MHVQQRPKMPEQCQTPLHTTTTPPPHLPTSLEQTIITEQALYELTRGWELFTYGDLTTAHAHATLAVEAFAHLAGPSAERTLDSLSLLGLILLQQQRADDAEKVLRAALAGRERLAGPRHPDTLVSVGNLAFALARQGEFAGAEVLHLRALGGWLGMVGGEGVEEGKRGQSVEALCCVGNLAYMLWCQGRFEEAAEMHGQEVVGYQGLFGSGDPRTLRAVRNLAFVLVCLGRWEEAGELFAKADGEVVEPRKPLAVSTS